MAVEYPELSTMPARTKRSSAKCTPPLLRNCTGALCPRKKTRSGKIFGVISAALRTTSFPSAGGLPAIAVCRCRTENARSNTDRRIKYFAKRAMEAPFRVRASYNTWFRPEKRNDSHPRSLSLSQFWERKKAAAEHKGCCDILRARLRDCPIGRIKNAGSAKFHEDVFGNGSGRNTFSGSVMGASTGAGCEENHQRND